MTDETPISPEPSATPDKAAPRVRRISNPRPKKTAKSAPKQDDAETPVTPAFPVFDEPAPVSTPAQEEETNRGGNDWPEPEPASSGASASPENPKRKRRRKKGKGGNHQNPPTAGDAESPTQPATAESGETAPASQNQQPRPPHPPRAKIDSELLAKFAWKIYLAEVSEEGVALVGDNDAKDLSRRCFRLAEIFLEEQARRR
jgi:hypothetical protein